MKRAPLNECTCALSAIHCVYHTKVVQLAERMADFDCFQPWGIPCNQCVGGEEPCEVCEAKALLQTRVL